MRALHREVSRAVQAEAERELLGRGIVFWHLLYTPVLRGLADAGRLPVIVAVQDEVLP